MADIVSTPDVLGGEPRIKGRRIGVLHVVNRVLDGDEAPASVAADFDLDIADVYRAVAYYYDHPDEMREWRRRKRATAETARDEQPDPEEFTRRA
ncbi:hypothetical protein BRC64_00615 [Halobacteriales archaeon QH_10_67_22]|nr:MAG: hypothetical protein BRC64_00615 [Halobacteriales archaeon QH_10_67_22]